MIHFRISLILFTVFLCLTACRESLPPELAAVESKLPEKVDFNLHIKPLLSDRCFKCHGPDKNNQKANLRLDTPEGAFAALSAKDSHRNAEVAIDPGSLSGSEVFHRITSTDPEYMMPTPESNLSLSLEEKALIAKWIQQGAEYKPHWSLIAPQQVSLPKVANQNWAKKPLDYFILEKLEKKKLPPGTLASKEQWIRRVSFDLTGLPPSPQEIDQFLKDPASNAYEKAVDRLMASPQYGERMAAEWLDLARYADSHGYQDDGMRNAFPYRDWVIKAFNQNLPYDKFVTWQLAGDMLPNPTRDMLVATCFNRNHPQTQEGGVVDEEYRVEYVADRTNTFGKAFLGITIECARCHDHKYDPISQKDYYQLFAFFNTNNDSGIIPYNGEASPTVILTSTEADQKLKFIRDKMKPLVHNLKNEKYQAAFETWLAEAEKSPERIVPLKLAQLGHFSFDEYRKHVDREIKPRPIPNYKPPIPKEAPKPAPKKKEAKKTSPPQPSPPIEHQMRDLVNHVPNSTLFGYVSGDLDRKPELVSGRFGKALQFKGDAGVDFSREVDFDREEPFSISIWFKSLNAGEQGTIFGKCNGEFEGERGYRCRIQKDGTLMVTMSYVWPDNCIDIRTLDKLKPNTWYHLALTYDGSSKAQGLKFFINGRRANHKVLSDNLHKSIRYGENKSHWDRWTDMPFMLGKDSRGSVKDLLVDELTMYHRQLSELEVQELAGLPETVKAVLKTPKIQRKPDQVDKLREFYLLNGYNPDFNQTLTALTQFRDQENQILTDQPEVMCMHEAKERKPTYVLARGAYDAPTVAVNPTVPSNILPFDSRLPRNRLGLAQWLFDERNPLTSRVFVNRVWMMCFGKGLVSTQEDFGNQGALPSHPELLDYLAVDFRKHNWDIKRLLREIVLSATYRQVSVPTKAAMQLDPGNDLYSRFPVYRLSAEMVRDNALAVSGLLVTKIGGKSVYPYQPPGIWEALATRNLTSYVQGTGEDLYRRSLYTVWKRSSPPPSMLTFDAPDRYACVVRRQKTSTPLQALVLLNDPQYVEAARKLAERMFKEGGESIDNQIVHGFRYCTSRMPKAQEIALLKSLFEEEVIDFRKNKNRASELLRVGESKSDPSIETTQLAALTVVANTMLNFDEFVMKR